MARPPAAVLFDFNGVLVDDESIHYRAFQEILGPAAPEISPQEYRGYLGHDDRATFTGLFAARGRVVSPEQLTDLVRRKQQAYWRLLGDTPRLFPGARKLVRELRQAQVPLAIVSGARRVEIEQILAAVGLGGCFPTIVAAEDVRRSKPDPAGYVLALRRLALESQNGAGPAIAIEDAPAGIAAARAAGLLCIAVASSCPAADLAAADRVAAALSEIDPAALITGQL